MRTKSGLEYVETKAGTGKAAQKGKTVSVHYAGRLENGKEFDNSHKRGQPIDFKLGVGQVIAGWDEGIAMMKEGGTA
ncbi:MAG: FKBP-type peptidyl-prolyl cis-trans isomerase, partial [Anaerolineales bacterium]|nr:FKBP-type peptidyl-prolyl cis-trans isomerase [Anaerolineales bacterium]